MPRIVSISVSHRSAPVAVRERLAILRDDLPAMLARLRRVADEAVVLSTCGRLEVYAVGVTGEPVIREIAVFAGCGASLRTHAAVRADEDAVQHLMRVASGLESPIPGEHHILGQVRDALLLAEPCNTVGPILSALFRGAIRCGRCVRTETGISQLAGSYAQYAMDAVATTLSRQSRVLVVGSGTLATEIATLLRSRVDAPVTIASRHAARGAELAECIGGAWHSLDALPELLGATDVVFCCTSSRERVLRTEHVANIQSRLTILDLGMPRNVDPSVGHRGHELLDLTDLAGAATLTEATIAEAMRIVRRELARFIDWTRRRARWSAKRHAGGNAA